MASVTLETLHFDNLALRRLPLDPEEKNYVRTVNGACFSRVKPTPVRNPKLVAYSQSAIALLDLPETELKRSEFVEYFSGNKLLPGSDPAAHCYCGHQFGYFAGQLGDGAAMYLGEVLNKRGERWEIQLKGAGLTPYSRQADGRKVLRSSIREFLCSEAMHHLGIPTTRAGSCITSDSKVTRDIFYDGNQKEERCTIVLRIAPTFLRFGSFEIFNTRDKSTGRCGPSVGRMDILQKLLDYAIETFFPQIYAQHHENLQEMYKEFFKEVVLHTARLVSQWQCVGFCHGVLNTDNMSILGLTIDYGPFGFMDRYDPDHICNASDDGGRYTFIKQPEICLWNLKKLAEALKQVVPLEETTPLLDLFNEEYQKCYLDRMRKKLGLISKQLDDDLHLVESLLETMELTGSDFTNSFRSLSSMKLPGLPGYEQSKKDLEGVLVKNCAGLEEMIKANKTNMDPRQFYLFLTLMQTNPDLLEQLGKGPVAMARVIARIERGKKLKEMTPEMKQEEDVNAWRSWLDKYSERLKLEAEEMQDEAVAALQEERVRVMNSNNPRIILRNYLAENAISNAEKGDFTEVWRLLEALQHPYDDATAALESQADKGSGATCSSFVDEYTKVPPEWALDLRVT